MNLRQINFRQPKYIFPLVLAVPATALIYFVASMFGGNPDTTPTDRINMNLPEAKEQKEYDKLRSMENRYSKDDNLFSAVDRFGTEEEGKESLEEDSYSEEEIQKIMDEAERKHQEQAQFNELQRRLNASTNRLSSGGRSDRYSEPSYSYEDEVDRRVDEIHRRQQQRMKDILSTPDMEEEQRAEANRLAREKALKEQEDAPSVVIKEAALSHVKFNTVNSYGSEAADTPLIKAMIDKTTKSTDGTRLRFKLLDDVIVEDVKLSKGTYLYGVVNGFGTQRVKANVSSILVGSRFIKVNLNVYDIDGMEGFYVPASAFREFMQNAAAGVAGQQIQFSNNTGMNDGINAETLALQALQNIYSAGSNAISRNLKKNKAKIKYNTIVYLINAKNVQ